MPQKRVRILLRVSSHQQLEADGDLSVQRQLVTEYVAAHNDWVLDTKEYFEGSMSGYKNAVSDRDILGEVYKDAEAKAFDVLVVYKDDRLGRRMWEVGSYVMSLKRLGVSVYTVKDGCISPESDDIMGQMVLALRYGNAQKASSDTGQRVKDTAQKLVQNGKFMGGFAPFGYTLEYSGEISKHGRALKHLVIVPAQAEVVRHIYSLSYEKEYGSAKIAKALNAEAKYRALAPHAVWKAGTVTSILTNPIYTGHTAYKRREHTNGTYRRLDREDWIVSFEANDAITIIEEALWNQVQEKRQKRAAKYQKREADNNAPVIRRNDGALTLIDVLSCGYCGCKMRNGSQYHYWTIKATGERKKRQIPAYQCPNARQGVPHDKTTQHRAAEIEPIVWGILVRYLEYLQRDENVWEQMQRIQQSSKESLENILVRENQELTRLQQKIDVMERHVPAAILGESPLSLEELMPLIHRYKEQLQAQQEVVRKREADWNHLSGNAELLPGHLSQIPTWRKVFENTEIATRRVLVDKLIERIDITEDTMVIRFQISLHDFLEQPRISGGFGVPK